MSAPRKFPEDFGPVLYIKDMAEIWTVGDKRAYQLAAEGAWDFALLRPRVGRISFSRDRVQAYLDGQVVGLTGLRRAI